MQAADKSLVKFLEGNDIDFVIPVSQRSYDWQTDFQEYFLQSSLIKRTSSNRVLIY